MMSLHDADAGQGGWKAADGQTRQLAVLREDFDMILLYGAGISPDGQQRMAEPIIRQCYEKALTSGFWPVIWFLACHLFSNLSSVF